MYVKVKTNIFEIIDSNKTMFVYQNDCCMWLERYGEYRFSVVILKMDENLMPLSGMRSFRFLSIFRHFVVKKRTREKRVNPGRNV